MTLYLLMLYRTYFCKIDIFLGKNVARLNKWGKKKATFTRQVLDKKYGINVISEINHV